MTTFSSPASYLHVSNLVTYGSLMSSIAAVAAALHGSAGGAGACIAAAVIADTVDGRFAGSFARDKHRRAFGAQLDSLSDAAAFGIGPAVCLFLLSRPTGVALELLWWGATFAYAASAITRLGFYNLTSTSLDTFVGVPVPVAALILSSALLAGPSPAFSIGMLVVLSAVMVAPWRILRPSGAGLALFLLWPIALVVAHVIRG
jgi:phosphatidylserine synthase